MLKECFLDKIIGVHNLKADSTTWKDIIQNKKNKPIEWKNVFPDIDIKVGNPIKDLIGIGL